MTAKSNGCSITGTQKGTGEGSEHWLLQRISAIGLIWLSLWFVKFCMTLAADTKDEMMEEFQTPYNATMMILFLSFSFYHGWLGLVEVMEDYIHAPCVKGTVKLVLLFTMLFLFVIGLLSILKLFVS